MQSKYEFLRSQPDILILPTYGCQIELSGCVGRACWSGKAKGLGPLHLCADLGQVDIGSARIGRRAATDAGRALNIILDENGGLSSQSIGAGIQWTFEMNPVWGCRVASFAL